jgi:magnesium transporter
MSAENPTDPEKLVHKVREMLERPDDGVGLRLSLQNERPEDVAEVLPDLELEQQKALLGILGPEFSGKILREVDEDHIVEMAEDSPHQVAEVIGNMEQDDAVGLLEELPDQQTADILDELPAPHASRLRSILRYPEDTAGRIMAPQFVLLWKGLRAGDAIKIAQRIGRPETGSYLFVADEDDRLIGYLPLHTLVFADPAAKLEDLMETDVISVTPDTDQEQVVRLATKYNLNPVPVVSADGKLIGVITADDILEAAEEEVNEDMYRMAGMNEEQDPVRESVMERTRVRLPWLLVSLVGGLGSAWLVSRFAGTIQAYQPVVFFMPLVALIGGNVAIQASTLVVRGLATGYIKDDHIFRLLWHESLVNGVLAVCCAAGAALMGLILVPHNPSLALALAAAIVSAVCVAGGLGMAVPLLCHKIGVDPAVSAGPFVTIINDMISVSLYLFLSGVLVRT